MKLNLEKSLYYTVITTLIRIQERGPL